MIIIKYLRYLLIASLLVLYTSNLKSQEQISTPDFPEVGKAISDFKLNKIRQYTSNEISKTSLQGKFVIIDFWNKMCISCVESFPKLNEMHNLFKDKLDLFLIGTEEDGIQEVFEKYKQRLSLEFPYSFSWELYKRFVPWGAAPHLLWINDKGIIVAITTSVDLNEENIRAFLAGKSFSFNDRSYKAREKASNSVDPGIPYLMNGNGGDLQLDDIIYRSIIRPFTPEMPSRGPRCIEDYLKVYPDLRTFESVYILTSFYRFAYTGSSEWIFGEPLYNEFYFHPILEVKDKSKFVKDGKYCIYFYSTTVPASKTNRDGFLETMQRDLRDYFGYQARVETRVMPYLKLVDTGKAKEKLKTKGGKEYWDFSYTGGKIRNMPWNPSFIGNLFIAQNLYPCPIIDETGIGDGKIDIDFSADLTDMEDIKRALKELGIEMVKCEKEYKVIVIKEIVQ